MAPVFAFQHVSLGAACTCAHMPACVCRREEERGGRGQELGGRKNQSEGKT